MIVRRRHIGHPQAGCYAPRRNAGLLPASVALISLLVPAVDERRTLQVLGWSFGVLIFGMLLLNAFSLGLESQ
jgi:hypothetical protein